MKNFIKRSPAQGECSPFLSFPVNIVMPHKCSDQTSVLIPQNTHRNGNLQTSSPAFTRTVAGDLSDWFDNFLHAHHGNSPAPSLCSQGNHSLLLSVCPFLTEQFFLWRLLASVALFPLLRYIRQVLKAAHLISAQQPRAQGGVLSSKSRSS